MSIVPQNESQYTVNNAISRFFSDFSVGKFLRKCNAENATRQILSINMPYFGEIFGYLTYCCQNVATKKLICRIFKSRVLVDASKVLIHGYGIVYCNKC